MTNGAVHLVDLDPFLSGGVAERRRVAALIDEACRTTGFLQITGHGVPETLMTSMLDVTQEFFDRPLDEKLRAVVEDPAANRGYAASGTEALAYSLGDTPLAPDLFEAFNAGRELVVRTADDAAYLERHRRFFAPNLWPEHPPEMRDVWADYDAAVSRVADGLMQAFAIALGVEESYFIDRTRRAIVTLRAINYERRRAEPAAQPGQMRMGQHTDYGVLTVLLADDVPGLQVHHDGDWHDVGVPAGSLIVNIGDMLATWTNDRWVSTLHRVVPPPASVSGPVRRRSVARFLEADPDCLIETIPSCVTADRPARYEPVEAGEYLLAKLLGPRELRRSSLPGSATD